MNSRATYLIVSIASHGILFAGLYLLTLNRELGSGVDTRIVRLSLIPGLEQLLEDDIPTGADDTNNVAPTPDPTSPHNLPERVVEQADSIPQPAEATPEIPEPVASEPVEADPEIDDGIALGRSVLNGTSGSAVRSVNTAPMKVNEP